MSSQSVWSWEEMIGAFRALGGTIENIRPGTGRRGRGLFPVDSARPVLLRVPENLLFASDDVAFADDHIRLKETASVGAAEREFFHKYQESFSWGAHGRAEWTAFVADLDGLPTEIRALLADQLGLAKRFEGDAFERAGRQFLGSRQIDWKGRGVLAPLIELANAGEYGLEHKIGDDLLLEGSVTDEVLVPYGAHDPFSLFFNYGDLAPAAGAYSLPMKMNVGRHQFAIGFEPDRSTQRGNYLFPELTREGSRISLSWLMLGYARYPSVPRGIFRALTKEFFGSNTDEVFDSVRHFNRSKFLQLLAALEPYEGSMIAALGKMARFQLEAISWSIGSADVYAPPPRPWGRTEAIRTAPVRRGWTWDDMLAAFRSLGGVAENIRLAYGAFGRGIFAERVDVPVRLEVPQNLLFPASDIVFAGDKIGIRAEAAIGAPEREFFARYGETFSWGGWGRAESIAFIAAADGLPTEVRDLLAAQLGMKEIIEGDTEVRAQNRFLRSRTVEWSGRTVVAPVAEFINHQPDGAPFGGTDSLQIEGGGGGEILASYRPPDAYGCFRRFSFASPEPGAFSIPMKTNIGRFELTIKREIELHTAGASMVMPRLERGDNRLLLSALPLGHPNFPRASRGIFRALMRRADIAIDEADEAFDRILRFNRTRFIALLEALAPHGGDLVVSLRKMARFQLEAMSWCIGAREI